MIRMYRIQGKTIREISEMYSCSVELVHKIINKNRGEYFYLWFNIYIITLN